MKCPNCGTTNGKTNKFCRECGAQLEGLPESTEQQETQSQPIRECAPDDVALGEELFGVMRLYESGDLDAATERINKIMECSPASATAHSIRALIYERRAENEEANGNTEASHGYLQSAVAEYEAIIDLNPDSVADREKLIALRMKLAGNVISQPLAPVPAARPTGIGTVREAASKIPAPVLAAGLTFFVLLVLLIALFPSSGDKKSRDTRVAGAEEVAVTSSPTVSVEPAAQPGSDFKVYTYPTPPAAPLRPVSTPEAPRQPSSSVSVPPVKLPSIGNELVIAPEPKKDHEPAKPAQTTKPAEQPPTTGHIKITPSNNNSSDDDAPSNASDGSSLLARAIELSNQKKYSEAVQAAQQASQAFQSDLAAGRNVTAAQRGVDNASKYIQLWRSMQ